MATNRSTMPNPFFISYSSVDGKDFALELADELEAGPPAIPVWLDRRRLRPGDDWDEQLSEAIKTCKGVLFVMTPDSVRSDSVCKNEWVRALTYKKPIVPLLLKRGVEKPFRLESRQHIDFSESFASALARLRKHVAWMDSAEGQLQALKHRLQDAQRELPRADAEQQERIKDDIVELTQEIARKQKVIDDPEAAERRVQASIDAGLEGERRPDKPVGGVAQSKFVNPPPLIAPTWFQDRHLETAMIGDFLKDDSLRLMTVVGRGGIGKTAMVCRLLRSLEAGNLPDGGGALAVDGIVYLSAGRSLHRPNLPDLINGLSRLLPADAVKQLETVYKNPQSSTRTSVEALTHVFPRGRTAVLLDNLEDLIAMETGEIKDAELDETLRALLELPPHGLKVIITSRVAPSSLALVQPGVQQRLDLEAGLPHPYAENILRAMDVDGKVGLRAAPDALLAEARERTRGFPRALEHLFGILSADRATSLQDILDNTRGVLPEQVVTVLVGEAFSRLDPTAQLVMQALAVYQYPVPTAAVDFLLQHYVQGVDSSRVLRRLVNMQFVRRDAGRYYLHQVDRDYALSRIAEGDATDRDVEPAPLTGFALRHRAAEWFKLSRKPREAWKSLEDLAAQLSEFELRCEGEDYDTAAALLAEFDYDYLRVWGHYRLMAELHERLRGNIADGQLQRRNYGTLGTAYLQMGELAKASASYERAIELAREQQDRWGEGVWLGNLSLCFKDQGQIERAIEIHQSARVISIEVGNRRGEASDLGNLANCHADLGEISFALDYNELALAIHREVASRDGEALDLCNRGTRYRQLGRLDDAKRCLEEALAIARDIGFRLVEADTHTNLAALYTDAKNYAEAERELEHALELAEAIGSVDECRRSRVGFARLHLFQHNLDAARSFAEAARNHSCPLDDHSTSAVLGLIALRQGDLKSARTAFLAAIAQADHLLGLTPRLFAALDTKGLSSCGLALCGDSDRLSQAASAYQAARATATYPGIVDDVLQLFDALAIADSSGMLRGVRPIAAGRASGANLPTSN